MNKSCKLTVNRPEPVRVISSDIEPCRAYLLQNRNGDYNVAIVATSEVAYLNKSGYIAWSTKTEFEASVMKREEEIIAELNSKSLSVLVTLDK